MAGVIDHPRRSKPGEPLWEIAGLYPLQGNWSEEDYLYLETNQLIEYHHGSLEFLPMPSLLHQRIVRVLLSLLEAWAENNGGEAIGAPMPMKVAESEYREPDVIFFDVSGQEPSLRALPPADVVMEVVSEGAENRKRDYESKRHDYARAGIAEYWIVDPVERRVTVLKLEGDTYVEHAAGPFGETLASSRLQGFKLDTSNLPTGG